MYDRLIYSSSISTPFDLIEPNFTSDKYLIIKYLPNTKYRILRRSRNPESESDSGPNTKDKLLIAKLKRLLSSIYQPLGKGFIKRGIFI